MTKYPEIFRNLVRWLKFLFTPVAILFLVYFGWESKHTLSAVVLETDVLWLIVSILLWASLHFISPFFTVIIFQASSTSINYADAFLIHAGRLPAKYLPGGIWHSVARAADYHNHGFSKRHIASYLLLENMIAAMITLSVGGLIVSTLKYISPTWHRLSLTAAVLAFLSLAVMPWLLNKWLLPKTEKLSKANYSKGVFCGIFYWFVATCSFLSFLHSLSGFTMAASLVEAGGIYLFSWGVGFIALFAPQGLGVAEFVAGNLLGVSISIGGVAALLVGFRVMVLLADFLVWFISIMLGRHLLAHLVK